MVPVSWTRCVVVAALLAGGCAAEEGQGEESLAGESLALHAGYRATLRPGTLYGGTATTLRFRITDGAGAPVTQFHVEHERLFHLIITSQDLSYFRHIHPTYQGDGTFAVNWKPPTLGDTYVLYAQYTPAGSSHRTSRFGLVVPGQATKNPVPVVADTVDAKLKGQSVLMIDRPRDGFYAGEQELGFMVHDSMTDELVEDLEPFLGAAAHLIAVKARAGGRVFLHGHAMAGGEHHGEHGAIEGAASGLSGDLRFPMNFPEAGTYRLWVQYRRAGRNVTQSFTIDVE